MKKSLYAVLLLTVFGGLQARADMPPAESAAQNIMTLIGQQRYDDVWNRDTSAWFKQKMSNNKDLFISSVKQGRTKLGAPVAISVIRDDHVTTDPETGYKGDIHAVTFRNKYQSGEYYERVVVIKDADGQYRLSGLFATPASGPVPN